MDVSLYDQSPIDRCLGCFQYFTITNKEAAVYPFIFSVDSSDEFPSRMDGLRKLIYDLRQMLTDCSPKGLCALHSSQQHMKLRPLSVKIYCTFEIQCSFDLLSLLEVTFGVFSLHQQPFI